MTKRRVKKATNKYVVGHTVTVNEQVAMAKCYGAKLTFWRPGYR